MLVTPNRNESNEQKRDSQLLQNFHMRCVFSWPGPCSQVYNSHNLHAQRRPERKLRRHPRDLSLIHAWNHDGQLADGVAHTRKCAGGSCTSIVAFPNPISLDIGPANGKFRISGGWHARTAAPMAAWAHARNPAPAGSWNPGSAPGKRQQLTTSRSTLIASSISPVVRAIRETLSRNSSTECWTRWPYLLQMSPMRRNWAAPSPSAHEHAPKPRPPAGSPAMLPSSRNGMGVVAPGPVAANESDLPWKLAKAFGGGDWNDGSRITVASHRMPWLRRHRSSS